MKEYDEKTLHKLQQVELMILKDFISVCEENNIEYFLYAGSGIGVERHQGFIPWDDDIDVGLMRDDYYLALEKMERKYGDKYIILNAENDKNYPLTTTHIVLRGTKFIPSVHKHVDCPWGICLDVFPFDKVSDNPKERKKQFIRSFIWSKLLIVHRVPFPRIPFKGVRGNLVHACCVCVYYLLKILHISQPWLYKKALKATTCANHYNNTEYIGFLGGTFPSEMYFRKKDIYPTIRKKFEGIDVSVPCNDDAVLTHMFGDYMQLPPVEKRKNHFPEILDFGEYGEERE